MGGTPGESSSSFRKGGKDTKKRSKKEGTYLTDF
jgi:hypothetical protein